MQLPAVHPVLEARDTAGGAAEAPTPRPAVVAVGLVKTYGSGEAAVTAQHCLAGLDSVDSGKVLIGDTDITRLKDKQLTRLRRSAIGFVFQSFNLLPTLTAAENIELPLRIAGELEKPTVSAVLDRLGGLEEGR